jgi:hypothetical protein
MQRRLGLRSSELVKWFKKLLGRKQSPQPVFEVGDLQLVPSSVTADRANAAMPATKHLTPFLALIPPPIDSELARSTLDDQTKRDYGPDPISEAVLTIPARQSFNCAELAIALYAALPEGQRHPMHYVITPDGQTTYLSSADSPEIGVTLIIGWSFWPGAAHTPETIATQAQIYNCLLAKRQEGFMISQIDTAEIKARYTSAQGIIALSPTDVTICARLSDGEFLDGKLVWNTLHQLGFHWGDMDCFQWNDPTDQTDYLIWVEADDQKIGYALPEEIAAGRQHFAVVRFTINLARTPCPSHVVAEMIKATEIFASETGASLSHWIDQEPTDTSAALIEAAQRVADQLASLGTKPGATSVCMLR